MLASRQEIPSLQSNFYRQQFHKLLRWLLVAIVIILLLLGTIIYFLAYRAPQKYYANTTDGKILELTNYVSGTQ
jgi:hypothetical protein